MQKRKRFLLIGLFSTLLIGPMFGQSSKLSLNMKNAKVESVLHKIETETKYKFSYNEELVDVDRRVSIVANDKSIEYVLSSMFSGTNVQYSITGDQIVLKVIPKEHSKKVKVKGNVKDESGVAMPGATVVIDDTTDGTVTDMDGNFALSVPVGSSIKISSIGYKTKYLRVSKDSNLNIVLLEDRQMLDEVVVVGYGTQKKVNLTGAVTTASKELLENRPIGNIAQGLQGLVPNLNITFNSGQPNEEAKINIRGNTSLNGGDALILVDGVEISDLSLINPQDVESISVLKDAL